MKITGSTILLVEDEPIIGFALEDMLMDEGARTFLAPSTEAALSVLESERIDVAILDVNVHGKTTYALAEVLRERQIPFVFATGYGAALHPEDFSGSPTITKPYNLSDIERAMESCA